MAKRLILLGTFIAVSFFATAERTLDSLFTVLDAEVAQADIYITRRQAMIDSLRAVRPMTDEVRLQIAEEYQHFQRRFARMVFEIAKRGTCHSYGSLYPRGTPARFVRSLQQCHRCMGERGPGDIQEFGGI